MPNIFDNLKGYEMLKFMTGFVQDKYWKLKVSPVCALAWIRNVLNQRQYHLLTEEALKATRTSDTVFIFGSGYSINDITPDQWQYIAQHNTLSFREFSFQNFVRVDYHLTSEVDFLEPYAARLRENPLYSNTIFAVQSGWPAIMGNNLIGKKLLPPHARIFRFRRRGRSQNIPPSHAFLKGIVHGFNSSISTTNFAYLMGWKHIVLAGIDLNDKRYFWLRKDETRSYEKAGMGITYQSRFTNADQIVPMFENWTTLLAQEDVHLYTLNPNSLLADVMPTYKWESKITQPT